MRRNLSLKLVASVMALGLVGSRATLAQGTPVGLYNFTEGTNGTAFHYHPNAGFANATFDFATAPGSPGTFAYSNPATFGCPSGTIDADIVMAGMATSAVFAAGPFIAQSVSFTITFTGAATSAFPGMNLLTVDATATLFGLPGGSTASIEAQTSNGDSITHSGGLCSMPIDNPDKDLSYSLSALTAKLAMGPDGDFKAFEAQLSGNGSAAAVPEPGALAMLMSTGVLGSMMFIRRRRA